MPNDDGGVAGRYTVRSVARAMRLVGAVAEGPPEGRTLSDLARELGASKSTTLALARTLSAFGYLRDLLMEDCQTCFFIENRNHNGNHKGILRGPKKTGTGPVILGVLAPFF